jgi:type IV pilus assembly protein PilB
MSDSATKLRAVDAGTVIQQPADGPVGVTPPRRRGGSGRFLTDVLVDLGFATPERVAEAVEEARSAGVQPEKVLLDQNAISSEQLSRAIAERYGLDHLDLGVFNVDMGAANLLNASSAKRYGAVPVAYVD